MVVTGTFSGYRLHMVADCLIAFGASLIAVKIVDARGIESLKVIPVGNVDSKK